MSIGTRMAKISAAGNLLFFFFLKLTLGAKAVSTLPGPGHLSNFCQTRIGNTIPTFPGLPSATTPEHLQTLRVHESLFFIESPAGATSGRGGEERREEAWPKS